MLLAFRESFEQKTHMVMYFFKKKNRFTFSESLIFLARNSKYTCAKSPLMFKYY